MNAHPTALGAAAGVAMIALVGAASAEADSLAEANVKELMAGDEVAVSRIPDGVYLRSVNDPDDVIWERLPEYRTHVAPAPPVHESVELRLDEEDEGRDIYFTLARTSERFYVRLRWRDDTADTATTRNRFRDGAAVQFAIGDEATSSIMGTGPEEPVNIWYWRSDADQIESLAAGGPGSTTRLEQQPVSGDSLYWSSEDSSVGHWVVVMSRPIETEGDHQISFAREKLPIAFALWQGSDGQRDGLKSVTEDWIIADIGGE